MVRLTAFALLMLPARQAAAAKRQRKPLLIPKPWQYFRNSLAALVLFLRRVWVVAASPEPAATVVFVDSRILGCHICITSDGQAPNLAAPKAVPTALAFPASA